MRIVLLIFLLLCFFQNFAQQTGSVDFINAKAELILNSELQEVKGKVTYTFKTLKPVSSIFIDAQQMQIEEIKVDEVKTDFEYDDKKIVINQNFEQKSNHSVAITYSTSPKKALYFLKDYQGDDQIWTQGQGKYTSNWLPSFDDMKEKVEFDITIDYDSKYEVIANGKLIKKEMLNDSIQRWQYDMEKPMSSYLVALVIGNYNKTEEKSESGIALKMYYYPKDSANVASTYKDSKQIFDFLEEEIGYDFPWQNYKQIPVKDFLYAGMENTGTTIFSDVFVVDEKGFVDRNYVNVNAHELAHQWFGDLVTETEGKHHWLQEGFATYYALLAEKEIFGEDYFLYKLYESAEQLTTQATEKKATSLLDPNASSLTFYQRGAWVLYALRDLIGDTNFKVTIHNYLEKFKFDNVTTDDFIAVAQEVSGMDLSDFNTLWIKNVAFPSQEALDLLTKSDFIKKYLQLAQERTQPLAGKWGYLKESLYFPVNDYIGQEVVYQLENNTSPEAIGLLEKAFETNNVYVRQAIANTMSTIPLDLKLSYETLLDDPSYATMEAALYHLWLNFPADKRKYLDKTKDVEGFSDKNVRLLWLVLTLSTPGYETDQHQKFYQELAGYTDPKYHFSTRENAFTYLESLKAFSDPALKNLVDGAVHHQWRFRNFCRALLDKLLKDDVYKKKYVVLKNELSKQQQEFLQKKLIP